MRLLIILPGIVSLCLGCSPEEPTTVPELLKASTDEDNEVRQSAERALREMGPAAVPELTKALWDEEVNVRRSAVIALGWIRGADAVGPLLRALKDEDADVRLLAAWALESIRQGR